MQRVIDSPLQKRVNRLVFWYSFFMSFPAILIIQNVSIFIFPFLFLSMYELVGKFITVKRLLQVVAILFGIGAIASVVNVPDGIPSDSFSRAIGVLPNYLYWVVLILFLTTYGPWIRLEHLYRGIFIGVIFTIIYYFFLLPIGIRSIPIFKSISQNAFAFLLICYTPIVVWYVKKVHGFSYALLAFVVLTMSGFFCGSRSGSLLVFSGGLMVFLLDRKSISWVAFLGVIGFFLVSFILETTFGRELIYSLNTRTYDLIYHREETLATDPSYLVRLAQIEKATLIYDRYPVSGIGLNNFADYSIRLPGKFEGARLVINKRGIDETSAHNSYFGFLAEGGLLLIIPFVTLLGICILFFVKNISRISPVYKPLFIGLIHMSIHLYFIYAILNVFAWFLIGLCCMAIMLHKK